MPIYDAGQLITQIRSDSIFEGSSRFAQTVNGTGAAVTFNASGVQLSKGTTTTGNVLFYDQGSIGYDFYANDPEFFVLMSAQVTQTAGNSWNAYITCGGIVDPTDPSNNTHFGFRIQNNNGVQTLYCTNALGGTGFTQTVVTIPGVAAGTTYGNLGNGNYLFYAKYSFGSKIDYYINGVLVATHTTNLPDGTGGIPFAANFISTAGTTADIIQLVHTGMSYENNLFSSGASSDVTAPVISDLNMIQLDGPDENGKFSVLVSWTTDEPATSRVQWTQNDVDYHDVIDSTLVTDHSVTINHTDAIAPNTGNFEATAYSSDPSGNTSNSVATPLNLA